MFQEDKRRSKEDPFPYTEVRQDGASVALMYHSKHDCRERFDPNPVVEICHECVGTRVHNDPNFFVKDGELTASWKSKVYRSRFSGSKKAALHKFQKIIDNVKAAFKDPHMSEARRSTRKKTLEMAEYLHSECMIYNSLVDWTTRLVSQDVKQGVYLMYGKAEGVSWEVVLKIEANYSKIVHRLKANDPP